MMQTAFESLALPDIQSTGDRRNVFINKVGVKAVRYAVSQVCVLSPPHEKHWVNDQQGVMILGDY